mmetsp:Transcript_109288/g.319937  ORF Transcript_109288/g.319937 Transcript_109288/m.319937 type:complete len:109 (-) Transcript_109288:22-348(-)
MVGSNQHGGQLPGAELSNLSGQASFPANAVPRREPRRRRRPQRRNPGARAPGDRGAGRLAPHCSGGGLVQQAAHVWRPLLGGEQPQLAQPAQHTWAPSPLGTHPRRVP